MTDELSMEALLERSSLGTPAAKKLRSRTSSETVTVIRCLVRADDDMARLVHPRADAVALKAAISELGREGDTRTLKIVATWLELAQETRCTPSASLVATEVTAEEGVSSMEVDKALNDLRIYLQVKEEAELEAPGRSGPNTREGEQLAELVKDAAQGDAAAWSALVDSFAPLVGSIIRGYRLNVQDAADVSQTTWLRLAENLDRLRQPKLIGVWLAETAGRECLQLVKRNQSQLPVGDVVPAEVPDRALSGPPEASTLRSEEESELLRGIAEEGILHAGPLTVYLAAHRAQVYEKVVLLSSRELALLENLLRHQGEVLSRRKLLQLVWKVDFDPGSNVVEVYVAALKRKIGADFIETVRGLGYRFVVPVERVEASQLAGDAHSLTKTECRVAEMVASGLTNREVAAQLFISPKTVEANLAKIYSKYGVRSRTELAARMAERFELPGRV